MVIFAIITFGLAVVRTIVPMMSDKAYKNVPTFIGHLLVAITMVWCYIWFLAQFVK